MSWRESRRALSCTTLGAGSWLAGRAAADPTEQTRSGRKMEVGWEMGIDTRGGREARVEGRGERERGSGWSFKKNNDNNWTVTLSNLDDLSMFPSGWLLPFSAWLGFFGFCLNIWRLFFFFSFPPSFADEAQSGLGFVPKPQGETGRWCSGRWQLII